MRSDTTNTNNIARFLIGHGNLAPCCHSIQRPRPVQEPIAVAILIPKSGRPSSSVSTGLPTSDAIALQPAAFFNFVWNQIIIRIQILKIWDTTNIRICYLFNKSLLMAFKATYALVVSMKSPIPSLSELNRENRQTVAIVVCGGAHIPRIILFVVISNSVSVTSKSK